MESVIKELYGVAVEYAANPADCSPEQHSKAFTVIELIEDGEHQAAIDVGLIY